MKTHWTVGLLLCAATAAASAQTPDVARLQASAGDTPLLVLPISVQDDEHRGALRLRDVLRQPFEGVQEPSSNKPYRLSVEERHRLREQLRSQSDAEPSKGKY